MKLPVIAIESNELDYYPFGMVMPGRSYQAGSEDGYKFGFQSQENDPELINGAINFKYRIEDARIGRFLSIDPLSIKYPFNSPYTFSENKLINGREFEGLEFLFGLFDLVKFSPALENNAVIPKTAPIETLEKIGDVVVRQGKSPGGPPQPYDENLSPNENFARWKEVGRMGHEAIESTEEFANKYQNLDKKFGEVGRPDGWSIDYLNKIIRLGEIKGATRNGIAKGLSDLAKYAAEARRLFPDFTIEQELFLYRGIFPVSYQVQSGDSLSTLAKEWGTTLEKLYDLNPGIDKSTGLIKIGQEIVIDIIYLDSEPNGSKLSKYGAGVKKKASNEGNVIVL